jgi:hypothetical protein
LCWSRWRNRQTQIITQYITYLLGNLLWKSFLLIKQTNNLPNIHIYCKMKNRPNRTNSNKTKQENKVLKCRHVIIIICITEMVNDIFRVHLKLIKVSTQLHKGVFPLDKHICSHFYRGQGHFNYRVLLGRRDRKELK